MIRKFITFISAIIAITSSILLIGLYIESHTNTQLLSWFQYIGYGAIVLLPINILTGLWLTFNHRWLAILPFGTLLINYNNYAAVLQFCSKQQTAIGTVINIATYNVHNFSYNHKPNTNNIARLMRDNNVDILCMQEYTSGRNVEFSEFGFAADNKEGLAVLSKYPILRYRKIDMNMKTTNGAMWADIVVNQDTIRVINAHMQTTGVSKQERHFRTQFSLGDNQRKLDAVEDLTKVIRNNTSLRKQQAQIISQHIDQSPYPVILCGDFNDTPFSFAYNTLSESLNDAFKDAGKGYAYTFRRRNILRIDYILYSPIYKAVHYISPDIEFSDHNPVICSIDLQNKKYRDTHFHECPDTTN